MHVNVRASFAVAAGLVVLGVASYGGAASNTPPEAELSMPHQATASLPRPTSKAWLIADLDTGKVIDGMNTSVALPIASIAKLFTAEAANRSDEIDATTTIVWQDVATEGSAGSLHIGEQYTLRGLLFPLLLSSSNDAGAAIARTLGTTYMRGTVSSLVNAAGLTDTKIPEATGLSAKDVSSARDLAAYLAYLEKNDPYILDITSLHDYAGQKGGWINNDPARAYSSFIGGKHGFIDEADHTFAGIFMIGGTRYSVVILGSNDLETDISQALSLIAAE